MRKLFLLTVVFLFLVTPLVSATTNDAVASWTMDDADTSGSTMLDSTANNNDGTIISATTGQVGLINESYLFGSGSGAYVTVPDSASLDLSTAGTISVWFNLDATTNAQNYVVFARKSSSNQGYSLEWDANVDRAGIRIGNGGSQNFQYFSYAGTTGSWTHLVCTWDGTSRSCYLDGVSKTLSEDGGTPTNGAATNAVNLTISSIPGGSGYNVPGDLDQVIIYDRALTSSEVSELYNSGAGLDPYATTPAVTYPINITSTSATPAAPNEDDTLTFTVTVNDTSEATANYTIYKNSAVFSTGTTSTWSSLTATLDTVPSANTAIGDDFYAEVNIINSSDTSQRLSPTTETTTTLTVVNRDPTVSDVYTDPSTPVTTADFDVLCEAEELDEDDLTFDWSITKNGGAFDTGSTTTYTTSGNTKTATLRTITSAETAASDTFNVECNVTDANSGTATGTSGTITVSDELSTVDDITFDPGTNYTTDDTTVAVVINDSLSGTAEVNWTITKNGGAYQSGTATSFTGTGPYTYEIYTIPSADTTQSDAFEVTAYITDGTSTVSGSSTETMTIQNRNPTVSDTRYSDATLYTSQDFTLYCTPADEDGDTLTMSYEVFINATSYENGSYTVNPSSGTTYSEKELTTIPSNATTLNDQVYFTCSLNDGEGGSASSTSNTKTVTELTEFSIKLKDGYAATDIQTFNATLTHHDNYGPVHTANTESYVSNGDTGYVYQNYTVSKYDTLIWQVRHGNLATYNSTIPESCKTTNTLQTRLVSTDASTKQSYGQCYTGTSWVNVTNVSSGSGSGGYTTLASNPEYPTDEDYTTSSCYQNGDGWKTTSCTGSASYAALYEDTLYRNPTTYTTTSGTINTGLDPNNETVTVFNVSMKSSGYIDTSYQNVNISSTLQGVTGYAYATFTVNEKITNNTVPNHTVSNAHETTSGGLWLSSTGTSTITAAATGYYNSDFTYTGYSAGDNNTVTVAELYDSQVTVNVQHLIDNSTVNNFTGNVVYTTDDFNESFTTTNGSVVLELIKDLEYDFYVEPEGYEHQNKTVEITNTTQTVLFEVYQTNSFYINFRDEADQSLITGQLVELDLISDVYSNAYNTTNGTVYVTLLEPATYTMRYTTSGYTTRFYTITLDNNTAEDLDLYLISDNNSDEYTVTILDETTSPVEGASVKFLKKYVDTNTEVIQEVGVTDSEGKTVFTLEGGSELYRVIIEYEGRTVKTTDLFTIKSTSLTFEVVLEGTIGEEYYEFQDISTQLYNTTGNVTFTWNNPTGVPYKFCLTLQRDSITTAHPVNKTCQTAAAGTLTLPYDNSTGRSYTARAMYYPDGEETQITILQISLPGDRPSSAALLFGQVMITLVAVFIGYMLGSATIPVITALSLIPGRMIGLHLWGWDYIIGFLIAMIVLTYIMVKD